MSSRAITIRCCLASLRLWIFPLVTMILTMSSSTPIFFYDAPHRLRHLIIEQQIIIDIGFIRLFGYDRNLTDPMEMRRVACCRGSKNSEIY